MSWLVNATCDSSSKPAAYDSGTLRGQESLVNAKTHKSYVDVRPDRFISTCVDVIEDHHKRDSKLFLNRQGQFSTEDDKRTFSIQGWVWRDGERTQAPHNCVAHSGGRGLVLNIDYANDQQVAESEDGVDRTES